MLYTIIIILVVIVVLLFIKHNYTTTKVEGMTTSASIASEATTPQTNEAIQNIASIYNNTNMTVSNLNVTGAFNYLPRGIIVTWYTSTAAPVPNGWLLCDGANGTPDLRHKFIRGAGDDAATGIGTGGGNSNGELTLTIDQIPAHQHEFWYDRAIGDRQLNSGVGDRNIVSTTPTHGTTSWVGGGKPVSILPPFYRLAYIMKA